MDGILRIVSDNIALYMQMYGLSQVDLATALGISPSAVRSWIKYDKFPRPAQIDKLCEIFNCTYEQLATPQTLEKIKNDNLTDKILIMVSGLNDEGKQKVIDYIDDISERFKR